MNGAANALLTPGGEGLLALMQPGALPRVTGAPRPTENKETNQ